MTEWGVVGVVAALVGLLGAVLPPILRLNASITRLTVSVEALTTDLRDLNDQNAQSHARLWAHSDAQDRRLAEHEQRIVRIEAHSPG